MNLRRAGVDAVARAGRQDAAPGPVLVERVLHEPLHELAQRPVELFAAQRGEVGAHLPGVERLEGRQRHRGAPQHGPPRRRVRRRAPRLLFVVFVVILLNHLGVVAHGPAAAPAPFGVEAHLRLAERAPEALLGQCGSRRARRRRE